MVVGLAGRLVLVERLGVLAVPAMRIMGSVVGRGLGGRLVVAGFLAGGAGLVPVAAAIAAATPPAAAAALLFFLLVLGFRRFGLGTQQRLPVGDRDLVVVGISLKARKP